MKRTLYDDLVRWKEDKDHKPLILSGARQTGKTWLLKEFGNNEYEDLAYISCDNNSVIKDLFYDFDIDRIIRGLSAISGIDIKESKTLIVLDEVQEVPLAITCLKYFSEDTRDYHVIVAGSLLGISLHEGTGFPVGKVDRLELYPMDFREFLWAMGKETLVAILEAGDYKEIEVFRSTLEDLLRQYYLVGGMPAIVSYYTKTSDVAKVRVMQKSILADYESDFSKHIPKTSLTKVESVWNTLPAQLAKENKKFIYGFIKKGARAKEYEDAIEWLVQAGLVYKVARVSKIVSPLKAYENTGAFKLYALDLGLLGAMSEAPIDQVLITNNVFTEYKGAFTEQYIAQELISSGKKLYYYTNDNSTLEIDFILQSEGIKLIDVKAGFNAKAKNLKVMTTKTGYPGLTYSLQSYRKQSTITNYPLFIFISTTV